MKQSQLTIAVVVLAIMMFVVTFAMNYLGTAPPPVVGPLMPTPSKNAELEFAQKFFPTAMSALEWEDKAHGHVDYWFHNPSSEPTRLGLNRTSCRCSGVEVMFLPKERRELLNVVSSSIVATRFAGWLPAVTVGAASMDHLTQGLLGKELLKQHEAIEVPGNMIGWVRLKFHGEKIGGQRLEATLWFGSPDTGKNITLTLLLMYHEPLRTYATLDLGTMSEEELKSKEGVSRNIICWSSTRNQFEPKAALATVRDPKTDPFRIGTPELLTESERQNLEREHNPLTASPENPGQVLTAWRIPVSLRALAEDGKTPSDLGGFRRRLLVSAPGLGSEPKSVLVTGRIRGEVEIGNDDRGTVEFGLFTRKRGRKTAINLTSEVPAMELKFDRSKTPAFLRANIVPESSSEKRKSWTLQAEVLPDLADGSFPRRGEPAYEDSAIYLDVLVPGKPPRSIRIPVSGTASES